MHVASGIVEIANYNDFCFKIPRTLKFSLPQPRTYGLLLFHIFLRIPLLDYSSPQFIYQVVQSAMDINQEGF